MAARLVDQVGGRPVLPAAVHPIAHLLDLDAEAVLAAFRDSQRADFSRVIADVERPGHPLHELFSRLPGWVAGRLDALFLDFHTHVMGHPVWRHPFFVRVFQGDITLDQARRFAVAYFNQIKNTRQCVAMAIGRFHGLDAAPEPVSELTQIALAQLVADEYGLAAHGLDDYPELGQLFAARTHIVLYRQFLDGLGIARADQDRPMLWGVADNVLIQRLVAADPAFTPLEALASVGLGMEWGVPEFFSLLLGGLIRLSERDGLGLTPFDLDVFIAHVRYDVLHAVSVMLVTSLHLGADDRAGRARVKTACNALMAGRFAMMSDLFADVFATPCARLADVDADPAYRVTDPRYGDALRAARRGVAPGRVTDGDAYRLNQGLPFI